MELRGVIIRGNRHLFSIGCGTTFHGLEWNLRPCFYIHVSEKGKNDIFLDLESKWK